MQWIVQTSAGNVTVTAAELVMQLTERGLKDQRPAHEELIRTLIDYLEAKNLLSKCNPYQIALMAMDLGYFYKVFLTQNKVTLDASKHLENNRASSEVPNDS